MISTKASADEIRRRFDADVERFSNLETGQTSTVDAALVMALTCEAAAKTTPMAKSFLDIGCGAGNYALSLLRHLPNCAVTLLDLSNLMLARARERVSSVGAENIATMQGDIREVDIGVECQDIIFAAASLHHLRTDEEYRDVFRKCHAALRTGGSFWVVDLVTHDIPSVQDLLWARYGDYLEKLKGAEARDAIFAYIEHEDTPRSVPFQLEELRRAGFRAVEVLHKNTCFAALGAVK